MRTLKLTIAYDGTAYAGWQRQTNALAIQQVLEEAFAHLTGGVAPTVMGAGRTDAGVHALAQVASVRVDFDLAPIQVQRALNVRLPEDIRVMEVTEAAPEFHAQFHAIGKHYRYRMITGQVLAPHDRHTSWHTPWPLNVPAMQAAAVRLEGTHDFASFQAGGTSITDTVRTVDRLALTATGSELRLDAEGEGFLRHMVRIIAGTLVEVGMGQRSADSMPAVLAARRREAAGKTAPPQGLTLVSVRYD